MNQTQFVLVGHPVAHSVSPNIHRAAYAELALDASYMLVDAEDRNAVERQIDALRRGSICGMNVTIPHKQVALQLADRADASAASLGAANVLRLCNSEVVAYNTDVGALVEELRELRTRVEGCACASEPGGAVVLGTGGAARAAVAALRLLGPERVVVSGRRFTGSRSDHWKSAADFEALGAEVLPWPSPTEPSPHWREVWSTTRTVVQATSAGMLGAAPGESVASRVPWQTLPPNAVAYDVVYNPSVTPFMQAASAAGLPESGGLGMLVGQAALAFELWFAVPAPRAVMMQAARRAMGLEP